LVSLFLMFGLPADTWIRLAVWLAIGLAIYFTYGSRHSRLANAD
jgi:APA family basic amino acid/polyamine antiporter